MMCSRCNLRLYLQAEVAVGGLLLGALFRKALCRWRVILKNADKLISGLCRIDKIAIEIRCHLYSWKVEGELMARQCRLRGNSDKCNAEVETLAVCIPSMTNQTE